MIHINRILSALFFLASIASAHAVDLPESVATPDEAKQKWDSLTPAQQEAFKNQMQNQAEEKKSAWDNLSPEEQAAKKADAKNQAAPRLDQMKTKMQSRTMTRGRMLRE